VAGCLGFVVLRRVLRLLGLGPSLDAKDVEIAELRHQLGVLRRQVTRPRYTPSDRLLLATLAKMLPRERWSAFLVTPPRCLPRGRGGPRGGRRGTRTGRPSDGRHDLDASAQRAQLATTVTPGLRLRNRPHTGPAERARPDLARRRPAHCMYPDAQRRTCTLGRCRRSATRDFLESVLREYGGHLLHADDGRIIPCRDLIPT
jgi:hypothetical protein